MNKKEPIQISSSGEFIEWVNQLDSGNYLFRGVPNRKYRIQASAYRRPKEEDDRSFEKFLQINRDLITDARLRGHGEKDGRELGDLEILAQLQHFGAATCLIDFTRNAQVALYFACEKDPKWEQNSQDSEKAPDGKVHVVCNDPLRFKKVTPDLLKQKIDYFFPRFQPYRRDRQLYRWEPGDQNNRIIAQQSIFVFGDHEFDGNEACIVEESCKENILIELERVSGITPTILYPDFDGFASLHREEIPYTELNASDYFRRAERAYSEAQYEEAILNYDKAIELDSQNSGYYEWRGYAKRALGRNNDAIDDFNKIVEIDGSPYAYEVRGKALLRLKRHQQAITDFSKMIEIAPDVPFGYMRRGNAKCELGQYQKAIADFDTVLQIDPSDIFTYRLRGNAKEQIRDLEGAKADFQKALTLANQTRNARLINEITIDLQRIEKRIAERT